MCADLAAKGVQLFHAESTLEVSARVDTGRRVTLEVDVVAGDAVLMSMKEVIEAGFEERGAGRVRGDVTAEAGVQPIGPHHHGHGVPADQAADAALDLSIAGVERLFRGGSVKKKRSGRSETRLAAAATAPGSKVHIDIGTWTQHIVDSLARRPRVGKNLQIYSADFSSVSRNACAMISYSIHELRNCSAIRERRGTLSVRPGAPWWGVGSETQFTCEPGGGQWLLRASSATKG